MFSLVWIMPPKVMTQSASRPTAAPRGRGTGRRVGREGRRVRESRRRKVEPNYEGEGQGNDQGVEVNDGVDGGDVRNVIENNDHRGCTYKDSLACNPKGYDGKGGAIVYTRWIEKIESVQDMSRCRDSQKVKYTVGSFVSKALTWEEFFPSNKMQKLETTFHAMVGAGHAAYTDRLHELARLVLH
ncbi:hypothetical protein Tco_1131435 [Tanacetum coccineum]